MNAFEHRAHLDHWSYFHRQTEPQSWTVFRDLGRFVQLHRLKKKVTGNHLLGFSKGPVRHSFAACSRNNSASQTQRAAMLHFILCGESVIPVIPLLRQLKPLLWRKFLVDVSATISEEKQEGGGGGI